MSFFIPKKIEYRIKTKDSSVKILEIAFGDLDEKDLVMVRDEYGRI